MSDIYIGVNGKEADRDHSFLMIVEDGEKKFYFGLVYEGLLIDPYSTRFTLRNRQQSKFKKISEATFKNYFKFLKTRQTLYLNTARRGMIK